jgi:hypothetical protein
VAPESCQVRIFCLLFNLSQQSAPCSHTGLQEIKACFKIQPQLCPNQIKTSSESAPGTDEYRRFAVR